MKIVIISDVHNLISKISFPEADLLLIAGDLTNSGKIKELSKFNQDLEIIKPLYKYGIVCISGNHDFALQEQPILAKSLITNANYIEDQLLEINGIKILGSPYSKFFYNWAFNLHPGEQLEKEWAKIPNNADIIMTHGPCYGILDKVPRGEIVGDKQLLEAILKIDSAKLVICGHIHHSYGYHREHNKLFVNGSICDESYRPINKPIMVEFNPESKMWMVVNY